jgi:hypothetical protein
MQQQVSYVSLTLACYDAVVAIVLGCWSPNDGGPNGTTHSATTTHDDAATTHDDATAASDDGPSWSGHATTYDSSVENCYYHYPTIATKSFRC